ncbi:MAG: hypothetical protein Ct9H300mP3_02550 [Gammaproteobacteria bacterium]|nr:MAG: hypothetical protein Ct9H300mP3_02550 [Gammaproteobacteria bacterium]
MVKKDSITKENNSLRISFVITDFEEDLLINLRRNPPRPFFRRSWDCCKRKNQ